MKANQSFRESEDAVSPVIAVILMVAITVVLSATVYVWVSGFGGNHNQPAHAITLLSDAPLSGGAKNFTVTASSSDLHYGDLSITRNGQELTFTTAASDCGDLSKQVVCRGASEMTTSDVVKAGDHFRVTGASAGDVLRIVDKEANTILYTVTIG